MTIKLNEFDRMVNKLGMQTRDTTHRHAWLDYNGVTVVRTMRSHGNSKFIPEHKIRKQLRVNQKELADLLSCHMKKEQYVELLVAKGIITSTSPSKAS